MGKTNYVGIDYGLGQTNIDKTTGIRFGVISQNTVSGDALNEMESDYGDPHCPKCGNPAVGYADEAQKPHSSIAQLIKQEDREDYEPSRKYALSGEYACDHCKIYFGSDECFPESPLGFYTDDEEYKVVNCLDSDLMVIKSPYFTYAQFCSPCVPGACNLNSPLEITEGEIAVGDFSGNKCYCLGHEWFDDGAPYDVFSIETGQIVNKTN